MADIVPTTAGEAVPYIVWGVLVLGFGLEAVTAFVHGQWLSFTISIAGLVTLSAAALYWRKVILWGAGLSPRWAITALMLLLLVAALAPYVEERHLPLDWLHLVLAPTPSAQQIAEAITPAIKAELGDIKQSTTPPSDVFSLIASLRAQLDTTKRDEAVAQRQLEEVKQALADARKPPLDPKVVPTWLNLDFGSDGKPSEKDSANIHWAWWNPPEIIACPFGLNTVPLFSGSSVLSDNRVCTADSTLLFLSFDRPVRYDKILLGAPPGFPNWEPYQQGPKSAIVRIRGKVTSTSVSIEIIK